jgi:hypothetical protein
MFECGMAGCFDIATYTLEYSNKEEKETAEICESCAGFWRRCFLDENETVNIKERELTK